MVLNGAYWQSSHDGLWLAEIPDLNLMVQAAAKEEIPEMVKDAIELLVDHPDFVIDAILTDANLSIQSNDPKKLIALIEKRKRAW